MNKAVIANVNKQYFARSETFMYFYLSSFLRINPICLSWSSFINTDEFPFPKDDCYQVIPSRHTLSGLYSRAFYRLTGHNLLFERILKARNAAIIHAHYGPVGWWALAAKRVLDLPMITTFYGYDVAPISQEEGREWPRRREELFAKGDMFLVEGPVMRKKLVELGCPMKKVHIQRIALKTRELPFRSRLPKSTENVIILFAGRFYEKKGLLDALRAIHNVWPYHKNMEFRIIGDGPLMSQVRAYIFNHRMEHCVHLLGLLNHTDYLKELYKADIFLHPSIPKEGLPLRSWRHRQPACPFYQLITLTFPIL